MPGKNCAFPGCQVSCSYKYKGVSMRNEKFSSSWSKEIVNNLFKYCIADND